MNLEDFYDYKNQLMQDLLKNETIVHLIDADIPMEEASKLAYSHCFPYEYVPETIQDGKTFVCFDVDIIGYEDAKTFYVPVLYIWVFSHRSMLRLPEGGVRPDKLSSEICKVVNGSMEYGLGEATLYSVKRFAPVTDYQGKRLEFHMREFSKQYNPNKYIPPNRKKNL